MIRRWRWLVLFALGVLTTVSYSAVAEDESIASKDVVFEIFEGVADKRSWDFDVSDAGATTFTAPAMALADLPKKYNNKGLIADRKGPFVVRGTTRVELPEGEYRFLLRSRGATRLFVDDKLVAETKFREPSGDGHGAIPELVAAHEPGLAELPPENQERLVTISLDGEPHTFRVEAIVADQGLRPELGELSVSVACTCEAPSIEGEPTFKLVAAEPTIPLSETAWAAYKREERGRLAKFNAAARAEAGREETEYWNRRHEIAREVIATREAVEIPNSRGADKAFLTPIDRFLLEHQKESGREFAPLVNDYAFLRRVSLDTGGVIPSPAEIEEFIKDSSPDRRARAIDRLLADSRWADHWTSYWQDVLAENPGIVKPELNNTGPFRYWIHESLADNKPFDRFVTELVMMEGSAMYGGPSGFGIASQNDAPMAEKAHVLAKAFLAVDLKCARCHDAPYHPFKQKDTFSLAAMLDRKTQSLPKTSTVPVSEQDRKPLISISLKPGDKIEPEWPFDALLPSEWAEGVVRDANDPRELLAARITSPANDRFAQVIVNRVWARYIGWGLAGSPDDWHGQEIAYAELLEYLSRDFVANGYDLKRLARAIFLSRLYQSEVVAASDEDRPQVALGPARRRMTAEQVLDSLFAAVDKPLGAEELTFDPAGRSPADNFRNLGLPERGWQFASLSNERDRPALSLPAAQHVIDVLMTFGWRESRQNPLTERDDAANVLQPLALANGVVGSRVVSLSDDGAITRLALDECTLEELVQRVFEQIVSRPPSKQERDLFVELLRDGFDARRTKAPPRAPAAQKQRHAVAWSNHHSPEATRIKIELERTMRNGDPPTAKLEGDWRERMEDMVWALVNSPEFVFVP
jgi:hypothetical protein